MNSTDPSSDMVLGGIDQFLPQTSAQVKILERVDDVMAQAVTQKNPEVAFESMKELLGVSQISGLAFAKFIYTMSFQWDNFKARESFESAAEDRLGRSKTTINRNFNVWEMLVSGDIPKEYSDRMMTMPIGCLIPIATMWKQGWEVESNQWMKLANAPDRLTISKIIREIKKVQPKDTAIQIEWYPEEGKLVMWQKSVPHSVYLTYDEADDVIVKGLARLLNGKALEK